jgi:chemotaxis regulatin CheY-phosphate phosphatase CheZ
MARQGHMTSANALTPLDPMDYNAIEEAVMETARGRWFLAEYAKRNRNSDTDMLLGAIGKLEEAVTSERTSQDMDRLRYDLMEMAKTISRTKSEIAALRPNGEGVTQLEEATEALDATIRSTERATSEILEAAEIIQETAWTLRERDVDDNLCDVLDRRATEIYTACSFQDLTAQRISKVVQVIRYLEGRINAMIDIWGGIDAKTSANQPQSHQQNDAPLSGVDMSMTQSDIDDVIIDQGLYDHSTGESWNYDQRLTPGSLKIKNQLIHDGDIVFAEDSPHSDTTEQDHANFELVVADDHVIDAAYEDVSTLDSEPPLAANEADHASTTVKGEAVAADPEDDAMVSASSLASPEVDPEADDFAPFIEAELARDAAPESMMVTPETEEATVEEEMTPDLIRRRAFAQIDAMSAAEKLRHFT